MNTFKKLEKLRQDMDGTAITHASNHLLNKTHEARN